MKHSKVMLIAIVLSGFSFQAAYADEGDSKLIGPMFQPIKVENTRALDSVRGQSLQDQGRIDGIVGPAMEPTVKKQTKSADTDKKGQRNSRKLR